VLGDQTAAAAHALGLEVSFTPSQPNSQTLAAELPEAAGRLILILQANLADPAIAETLRARGAQTTNLTAYTTHPLSEPDPKAAQLLQANHIDAIIFASPSAVHGFARRLPDPAQQAARQIPAIAIGPSVAATLTQAGFNHVYTAAGPNLSAIAAELRRLSPDNQPDNQIG
jgi:uroporphyrinogen-III synthase